MRRLALFAVPALLLPLSFACEDDFASSPGVDFPEAGAFDGNVPPIDSGVPDAPPEPDADAAPPAPLPVTVLVTGIAGPRAGVTVYFHDAGGAVTETKTTGADGRASSSPSPTPSMATVVFPDPYSRHLVTWTGLQGGDVLPVVAPLGSDTIAQVDVTLPGPFTDAGGPAPNYSAYVGGCSSYTSDPGSPVRVYVFPWCWRGTDAVMVQGGDVSGSIVAHSVKKPIAPSVDGGISAVATDPWKFPPTDVKISVSNTTNIDGTALLQQIAGKTAFPDDEPMGDAYEATFKAVSGTFADAYQATVVFSDALPQSRVALGKRGAPATQIAFDANDLPPALTASAVTTTNPKRPSATWTGDMTAMKGGIVRFFWFDYQTEHQTTWEVVVPNNTTAAGTVTTPALTAAEDDYLPAADGGGSTWEAAADVAFIDSNLVPDFGTWRKVAGAVMPPSLLDAAEPEDAVLPTNGTFRMSHYRYFAAE